MRGIAIVGMPIGIGVLIMQARGVAVHEQSVHCEVLFERMPDTFPPKKIMRGIEEVRAKATRIIELPGEDNAEADTRQLPDAASVKVVGHAA